MRLQASLERFAEHMLLANPFDSNRVTQVDSLSGDVPEINQAGFEQLKLQAARTRRSTTARGVVVSGPPGIGKSHLLARFGQWARSEKYPFVYLLNLQAGPQEILRTILRTLVSVLTRDFRRAPHHTRMFKLVSRTIREAILRYSPETIPELRRGHQLYIRMLEDAGGYHPIQEVLWQYFEDIWLQSQGKPSNGRAELARRWLSGELLDPGEADRLQLRPASTTEDGCSLSVEDMKQVIAILCQFAGYRDRCLILCFDQVDTLGEEQVRHWSSTVHALLDACPGLLVVTSGVDETFLHWTSRHLVSQASWDDRIRQFSVLLPGIDAAAAAEMLKRRLQDTFSDLDALPEIAALRLADVYFPLGRTWIDRELRDADGSPGYDLRPRDVIGRAGVAWERHSRRIQQDGVRQWLDTWPASQESTDWRERADRPAQADQEHDERAAAHVEVAMDVWAAIDRLVSDRLAEHIRTRQQRPEELPVDSSHLTGLLRSMLSACASAAPPFRDELYGRLLGCRIVERKGATRPPFQMIVEQFDPTDGSRCRIGVAVADATRGQAATNMLKRMLTQLTVQNSVERVLLVIDDRSPLKLGTSGEEQLLLLQATGSRFSVETLSFEQYAALDGLEAVVGLARAGDMAIFLPDGSPRAISAAEVCTSHHRLERYLRAPVLSRLLDQHGAPDVSETHSDRMLPVTPGSVPTE